MCLTLRPYESARLLCPWYTPVKNTGVGCHALLQGIFPHKILCLLYLLYWQVSSLPLALPGKPNLRLYKVLILYTWYIYKLQNGYYHLTEWTWIWANSRRQRRTGKPGVLQSRRSQRVRHNLATEQQKLATSSIHPLPFLSDS